MVGSHAAVGLVVLQPEQPDRGQFREELVGGEGPGRLPIVHVGLDLPLEEIPERLAKQLMLVRLDHRRTIPPVSFSTVRGCPYTASVTDRLVAVLHRDGIRTLTLDSPHNRNALSSRLLGELDEALREATGDIDVRAIVLSGTGTVFCSGADLSERARLRRTACPTSSPPSWRVRCR